MHIPSLDVFGPILMKFIFDAKGLFRFLLIMYEF